MLAFGTELFEREVSLGAIEFTLGSVFVLVATIGVAVLLSRVVRFILAGIYGRNPGNR